MKTELTPEQVKAKRLAKIDRMMDKATKKLSGETATMRRPAKLRQRLKELMNEKESLLTPDFFSGPTYLPDIGPPPPATIRPPSLLRRFANWIASKVPTDNRPESRA